MWGTWYSDIDVRVALENTTSQTNSPNSLVTGGLNRK